MVFFAMYTIIFEFRGGTYIKQVLADDPKDALLRWAKDINTQNISGMGPKMKSELYKKIRRDTLILIEGCKNVWCTDAFSGTNFGLINVIKTDQKQ